MSRLLVRGRPWALPVLLGLTVIAFSAGSGSIPEEVRLGSKLRWVALIVAWLVAAAEGSLAMRRNGFSRAAGRTALLPATFIGLALLSAAWSPLPRLTFERAVSLAILFSLGWLLALAAADLPSARRRLLGGLAVGASLVLLAGVLLAIAGSSYAVQQPGPSSPWRLRGILENPNTIGVLAAIAAPLLAWLGLGARSASERSAWWAGFLLALGSLVASQSRGGLVAGFVGAAIVLGVLVDRWPQKMAAVTGVAVVLAAGVVARQQTQPAPPVFTSAVRPGITTPTTSPGAGTGKTTRPGSTTGKSGEGGRGNGHVKPPTTGPGKTTGPGATRPKPPPKPQYVELPARQDEIGNPLLSVTNVSTAGSGRIAAWRGALRLVKQRPILGYGFGTESHVFVDRWYYFEGGTPENSSLGVLLQLGALGYLVLVAILAQAVWLAVRAMRLADPDTRGFVAAGLGVLGSGVVLTFIQSYVYSVGNVATFPLWTTFFLFVTSAGVVLERRARGLAAPSREEAEAHAFAS